MMEGSPNTSADIFANSSTETVTEQNEFKIATIATAMELDHSENYPPPPFLDEETQSSLNCNEASMLVNEFLTDSNLPTRICCPFCILDFGFEFILKDHITKTHSRELKTVLKCNPEQINFHQCPFCQAKFYVKDLLPKHIIRKHEICVVNMFSGFSPEKYVYCRFCPHKSLRKHYKLLMIHIEQKHFKLFEKFIISKYSNITQSFEDIINLETGKTSKQSKSPGLSDNMLRLTTKENNLDVSPSIKSILKPRTAYPIEKSENLVKSPEPAMYENMNVIKRKARRTLRFDLPDSPDFENKENVPKRLKLSKLSKWKLLRTKGIQPFEYSPSTMGEESVELKGNNVSPRFQFACGLCSEAFDMNVKLLEHLRRKHKGLKLQAQYRCGECKAKFYRNSYLVRHCWFHHGPLCLKTPAVKNDKLLKF